MKYAKWASLIMWGGCFGFAMMKFVSQSDWGMFAFALGIVFAVFYLISWMIIIAEELLR